MGNKPSGRLRQYQTDDWIVSEDLQGGRPDEVIRILQGFEPGQFYTWKFEKRKGTGPMQNYLKRLQDAGLDIGRGEAEFGYKMPLPGETSYRDLQIFRRHPAPLEEEVEEDI